jgi:aminoglycoside phosphotransferase (APT) family kinase protein
MTVDTGARALIARVTHQQLFLATVTLPHMEDASYFDRLVDVDGLAEYLASELGPAEEFTVEHHGRGHSNETLFVQWGDERLVLRRPPPGETASRAHDVLREYRVLDALQETAVPVPETVLACEDESVAGSEFYLMRRVRGTVLRDGEPPRFRRPASREHVGHELVDTLARIHRLDWERVDLGEFGRPAGFTRRQVDRWTQQLEWAFDRTAAVREVPTLREVGAWLDENVPEDHPRALVHGDFKLDNVMFGRGTPPSVAAVFDWELSTLGDPLTDLGWLLANWRAADDADPATELVPGFLDREGYPSRIELVARYEDVTGITYEHDRFYRTLAVYKLAALGEMFFRRHLDGDADDPLYPKMEAEVPAMADRAREIVAGERPL